MQKIWEEYVFSYNLYYQAYEMELLQHPLLNFHSLVVDATVLRRKKC